MMRLSYIIILILGWGTSFCTGFDFNNNPGFVEVPKERSSRILVWADVDAECFYEGNADYARCDTCLVDNGSFSVDGLNVYADPCTPSCDSQSTYLTLTVTCDVSTPGDSVSTTVEVYFMTDCGQPSQPGVIFEPPESTLENSAATVLSCDTDNGYVGTPTVSSVYCESSGEWELATGCTESCNGKFNCWPGDCGAEDKPSDCSCSSGFQETAVTTCEITDPPTFESCFTEVTGPSGQKKTSSTTGLHVCSDQTDIYGNFNPTSMHYNLMVHYDAGADDFPDKPFYVTEYKFGVSDLWFKVVKEDAAEKHIHEMYHTVHLDTTNAERSSKRGYKQLYRGNTQDIPVNDSTGSTANVIQIRSVIIFTPKAFQRHGTVTEVDVVYLVLDENDSKDVEPTVTLDNDVTELGGPLQNKESLCLWFYANGGGFLKTTEYPFPKVYDKAEILEKRCYLYDASSPVHCTEFPQYEQCNMDSNPLRLERRISQTTNISVQWEGWIDAYESGGDPVHNSGIDFYTLIVNEMMESNGVLMLDTDVIFTKTVDSSTTEFTLEIPTPSTPKLYCVSLEVKDHADNVAKARRFFLYDTTSQLSHSEDENKFYFTTATADSDYKWQSNKTDFCVTWKDYFYNQFYLENNLLAPIEPDPHHDISGIYEQADGLLPVSGTPSSHGVVNVTVSYSTNNGPFSAEIEVPDIQSQTYCETSDFSNVDSITVKVRVVDILGNEYSENRTVSFDGTEAVLENVGLVRGGLRMLTVHHDTDLSTMDLQLDTYDPESGIRLIEWEIGDSDEEQVLDGGTMQAKYLDKENCPGEVPCVCPSIGESCERQRYSISLNGLVSKFNHIGNHNRKYFFTVTVLNNAGLRTTERLEILIDESSPQTGVVLEGPIWGYGYYPDIDYTSGDSILVHWYGFLDHESDIKLYELSLSDRCLSSDELINKNATNTSFFEAKFPDNALEINATFFGKRFVSVTAINNAMEPSDVLCSDGITRDIMPPEIINIALSHAKWSYSTYCMDNTTWMLRSDLVKVQLNESYAPSCDSNSRSALVEALPIGLNIDEHRPISNTFDGTNNTLDELFNSYDSNQMIYLPNDRIHLQWGVNIDTSPIDEFLVGFGRTFDESDAPSLIDYETTQTKRFFEIRHAAIGTDEEFFIFLKAVSKTGLETIIPIGPVLIDETPPNAKDIPDVSMEDGNIVIGWDVDTFYDDEQTESIDMIKFQIGHDDIAVTDSIEWQQQFSEPCTGYSGGCLKYPLVELQKLVTDLGFQFYVTIHVFNKAGHALTIRTSEFTLPMIHAPAKSVIIDIDPNSENDSNDLDLDIVDIDVHLSSHKLCAAWNKFSNHGDIQVAFGAGTVIGQDDVYAFTDIGTVKMYCVTSLNIPNDIKLFVTIRATSSGGVTDSSSDGVIIFSETRVLEQLKVFDGPQCMSKHNSLGEIAYAPDKVMKMLSVLRDGAVYTLRIEGQDLLQADVNIKNFEFHVQNVLSDSNDYVDIVFQPYNDTNELSLPPISPTDANSMTAYVYDCVNDIPTQIDRSSLHGHWNGISEYFTFETAAVTSVCNNDTDKCTKFLTPYSKSIGEEVKIADLSLEVFGTYHVAVRPCLNSKCLNATLSSGVSIELNHGNDRVQITEATLETTATDCSDINIMWEPLYGRNSFYKWTVMAEAGMSKKLTTLLPWELKTIKSSNTLTVRDCVSVPVHAFKEMYACVRAYTQSGQTAETCQSIAQVSKQNAYKTIVYEFDGNAGNWDDIKTVIQSAYVGDAISIIHDAEVDFATKESVIVGAILGGKNRKIKWYLMSSPTVPQRCETPNCKASLVTSDGYVQFPASYIQYDKAYFTCVAASEMHVVKGETTEVLPEIKACSNGFLVDDTPPSGGEIYVNDMNGYIGNVNDIEVAWDGFGDSADVVALGYHQPIRAYTVAIGSGRYGDDIMSYRQHGDRNFAKHVFHDLTISSGASIYISVTAHDQAGLNKSISSEQLIVDTTPPFSGHIRCSSLTASKWFGGNVLKVHLTDFYDDESGIDFYSISVGSHFHTADVLEETTYKQDLIDINIDDAHMTDGHTYHLGVKAVNRAGLSSDYKYLEFSRDQSPPSGGHVMDRKASNGKDMDFQVDTNYISGSWKGFIDPQSGISYYRVGLGTAPFERDLKPMLNVGLNKEITWESSFDLGEAYYITVDACNGAGLCVSRTSNGIILDDSPPVQGQVLVGSSSSHHTFVPHKSFLGFYWTGFEDPQSGMDRFEACIGTAADICDVVSKIDCLHTTSHIQGGLNLPTGKELFAVVTGYNKHNQSTTKASKYFIVDITPPDIDVLPVVDTSTTGFSHTNGQWEISVLKLKWLFTDAESPITRHVVTLKTHHEGHTPVEHMEFGKENEVTITFDSDNWLHIGDTYSLIVTACNDAGLCTTAKSNFTLVMDSTPPHVGGFLSKMTWRNEVNDQGDTVSVINATWYGFRDYESGVIKYHLGVGRTFTENELTNGLLEIDGDSRKSEQGELIYLNVALTPGDKIIVSILAENGVGLMSPIAKVTLIVNALIISPSGDGIGTLEIEEHSCDIHFCNKDCTCAAVDKTCYQTDTNMTCNAITETENNAYDVDVHVFSGTPSNHQRITTSSSCIAAYWTVDKGEDEIKRFEWTVGLKDEVYGEGIFDLSKESPWMDVGKFKHSVHCLHVGRTLLHGFEYVVYLRVWVDVDTYLVYESDPLLVDNTPPAIRKGEFVKDSDDACLADYDTIDWVDKITACWDSVFYDAQSDISHYLVSLGTKTGADDIMRQKNVGLDTRIDAKDLDLHYGQHYFLTVTAYNRAGLHTVVSSDGFIVDIDGPVTGVVYNTDRNRNLAVQSETSAYDLSWHGFVDPESGVKGYYVALFEDSKRETMINAFTYVDIQTSVKLTNLSLEHGTRYYGAVKAINTGELPSNTVVSKAKLIDTTPPTAYTCERLYQIYQTNTYVSRRRRFDFETDFTKYTVYIFSGSFDEHDTKPVIKFKLASTISVVLAIEPSHEGRSGFSYHFKSNIEGTHNVSIETESQNHLNLTLLLQECTIFEQPQSESGLIVTQLSPDTFKTRFMVTDRESGIKSALLGFGSSRSGFQYKSLYHVDISSDQVITLRVPHGSKIYSTSIIENTAGLTSEFHAEAIVADRTPPEIEHIAVEKELAFKLDMVDSNTKMMRLNVSWRVRDDESDLGTCYVSVGTKRYNDNVLQSMPADLRGQFFTEWFEASHGNDLYTNIKCLNKIGLSTVEVFGPVKVSLVQPSVGNARLKFIPRSQRKANAISSMGPNTEAQMTIQSSTNKIQFEWDGIIDDPALSKFEYRLSAENEPLTEWVGTGLKDTVSINNSFSDDTTYKVEVSAVNIANIRSDIINATLLIDSRRPELSGQHLMVSSDVSERVITLDWQSVFLINKHIPTYFEVTVGSAVGYCDVAEENFLSAYTLSIPVSKTTILTKYLNEAYIVISAIYETGERASYSTSYTLPF